MLASPSNRELGDEEQGWEEVDTVGLEEDLRWRNDLWQPSVSSSEEELCNLKSSC